MNVKFKHKDISRDLGNLVEEEVFNQIGTTGKGTYYVLRKTNGINGVLKRQKIDNGKNIVCNL